MAAIDVKSSEFRLAWIDVLRAFAMILVVYGHQVADWTEFFVFTSPVKMPLFFAITGYVFNYSETDSKRFLEKIIRKLVIPWLVLSIFPYLLLSPFKGLDYLLTHIYNILVGKEIWFMPCCIIAEIIWFFLHKYLGLFKKNPIWLILVTVISTIIGLYLHSLNVLNIFMINRAFVVLQYILIGYFVLRFERNWEKQKNNIIAIGGGIYFLLCFITLYYYPGQCLDVHVNRYYNLLICEVMIWIGVIILFLWAKSYLKKGLQWLTIIGQHTLVIYIYHSFVVVIIKRAFALFNLPVTRFSSIFIVAVACITCCIISLMLNKYTPCVVGKKRR